MKIKEFLGSTVLDKNANFTNIAISDRINKVSSNPYLILEGPGTITIKKDIIIYSIENAQCNATAKFDKKYNLIECEVQDTSTSIGIAILIGTGAGAIIAVFAYYICAFLMSILCGIYLYAFKDYQYD